MHLIPLLFAATAAGLLDQIIKPTCDPRHLIDYDIKPGWWCGHVGRVTTPGGSELEHFTAFSDIACVRRAFELTKAMSFSYFQPKSECIIYNDALLNLQTVIDWEGDDKQLPRLYDKSCYVLPCTCPAGMEVCSRDVCANIYGNDWSNCGRCGWECSVDQICHNGACRYGPRRAPPEAVPCSLPYQTGVGRAIDDWMCGDGKCQCIDYEGLTGVGYCMSFSTGCSARCVVSLDCGPDQFCAYNTDCPGPGTCVSLVENSCPRYNLSAESDAAAAVRRSKEGKEHNLRKLLRHVKGRPLAWKWALDQPGKIFRFDDD